MQLICHRAPQFGANACDQLRLAGQPDLQLTPKLGCAGGGGINALLFEPFDLRRRGVNKKKVFAVPKVILGQRCSCWAGDAVVTDDQVGVGPGG